MSATRTSMPTLSDEDLAHLTELIKDADGVELRLTVPESDHRSAAAARGMEPWRRVARRR